jgi:lipid-binding SYLF domain-containing protein
MRYTKCWVVLVAGLLALVPFSFAKNPSEAKTEQDRLQNAGKVMQEILNVPDDIPQDLIDKARCVVVMPSVLKAAFVVGGQLRPRHNGVPHRKRLHGSVGGPSYVRA